LVSPLGIVRLNWFPLSVAGVYAPVPICEATSTGVAPVKVNVTTVGVPPLLVEPPFEPPPQPARNTAKTRQDNNWQGGLSNGHTSFVSGKDFGFADGFATGF
jgi:hypothetical protein